MSYEGEFRDGLRHGQGQLKAGWATCLVNAGCEPKLGYSQTWRDFGRELGLCCGSQDLSNFPLQFDPSCPMINSHNIPIMDPNYPTISHDFWGTSDSHLTSQLYPCVNVLRNGMARPSMWASFRSGVVEIPGFNGEMLTYQRLLIVRCINNYQYIYIYLYIYICDICISYIYIYTLNNISL